MIETTLSLEVLEALLSDLERGGFMLDCGDADFPRIRHLVRRYESLQLDFADAAVIACAERNAGRILTFDMRDFSVITREGTITVVPEAHAWG